MNNTVKSNVMEFILGGKAEFTILNRRSGTGVKYKVIRKKDKKLWFIYVYEDGWEYAGFFRKAPNNDLEYKRGERGKCNIQDPYIKALYWVMLNPYKLGQDIELIHHGKCSVCGRKLTDEESINRGIGPTCFKKVFV